MTDEEIQEKMTYHAPSEDGKKRHALLSDVFTMAMQVVNDHVPPGREQAVAWTKIEEAKFWASAGVARNPVSR
jgi:hypothetical protein